MCGLLHWDSYRTRSVRLQLSAIAVLRHCDLYKCPLIGSRTTVESKSSPSCNHIITSCARGDTLCLRPLQVTISSYLFARWHLFRHVAYLRHQQQVDLWPFDFESGVRVTCDVGYLCDNFSLPRPLCSRVRPDVRDRQTSDKSIA